MHFGNRSRFAHLGDGAEFTASTAATPDLSTDRVRSTIDYSGTTDPFDYFVSFIVYGGRAHLRRNGDETILTAGDSSFYPLGIPQRFTMSDLNVSALRLPITRIEQLAEETTGVPTAGPRFEAVTPISLSMKHHWWSVVNFGHQALIAHDSPMTNPLLAEELVRTVGLAALATFPNTTMTSQYLPGPGNVAPAAMRRAVAYIDQHAAQPMTASDIATAARVGDTTPLQYLRTVRLEAAHRELQAADSTRGDTVATVAA